MLMKQHSAPVRALKYTLVLPLAALFVLLFQQNPLVAQTPDDKPKEVFDIEIQPQFPGGQDAMMEYLGSTIKYPKAARKAKAEGMVILAFVIGTDGSVSNVENKTPDMRSDLLAVSMRVIEAMPKWIPGVMDGKPVKVRYTLPIRFRLK